MIPPGRAPADRLRSRDWAGFGTGRPAGFFAGRQVWDPNHGVLVKVALRSRSARLIREFRRMAAPS
jgi:hypothetical protein